MENKHAVCGSLFTWDTKHFTMIQKKRPEVLKDKWNFVGGKILDNEHPRIAMARVFEKQANAKIDPQRWLCFHIEQYWNKTIAPKVYYFASFGDEIKTDVRTVTDEDIAIMTYEDITFNSQEMVFNIPYILLMLQCQIKNRTFFNLNPEGINNELAKS